MKHRHATKYKSGLKLKVFADYNVFFGPISKRISVCVKNKININLTLRQSRLQLQPVSYLFSEGSPLPLSLACATKKRVSLQRPWRCSSVWAIHTYATVNPDPDFLFCYKSTARQARLQTPMFHYQTAPFKLHKIWHVYQHNPWEEKKIKKIKIGNVWYSIPSEDPHVR